MTLQQQQQQRQQQQQQLKPKVIQHGDDDNDDEALSSSSSFCHRTVHSSSNNSSTSRRLLGIPSATSAAAAAAATTTTTTTTTAYFSSSNSSTRTCNTNRHGYSTKAALLGTAVTLLLFVVLAVLYAPPSSSSSTSSSSAAAAWKQQQQQQQHHRSLSQSQQEQVEDDNNSNNNNNNNNNTDYSHYSCHDIYDITPEPGDAQCAFGRTCNAGSGVWAPSVFCHNNNNSHSSFYFSMSTNMLFALYSPIMLLWMILLFRMLASTAEDFFSPALEMLSVKLGLPPRFAGVSLLALGNGAADVSATVSAITNDPAAGYQMATGALTGAAMFISAVVSAVVVFTADGVPCRGALVRDVCMLCLTAVLVFQQLHTTTVGPETMTLFLSLYMIFVVLVLVADIYHRTVVVPRLQAVAVERERMRQLVQAQRLQQQQEAAAAAAATAAGGGGIGTSLNATNYPMSMVGNTNDDDFNNNMLANSNSNDYSIPSNTSGGGDHLAHFITALSNYDNQDLIQQQQQQGMDGSTGWGIESDDLARDRPIMLHGTHGILRGDGHLPSNDTTTTTAAGASASAAAGAANGQDDYHHYHHHGDYSMLHDAVDRVCVEPGSLGIPATNWIGALQDGQAELLEHASAVWEDIAFNADVDVVSKFLLICELPFTTLRKLTVPIPCEGYYVRALVALSMAISPLWFAYYLWDAHEFNILASSGWFYFLILWLVICLGALLVLRYAPGGEGSMALVLSTPIALYGFVIAATWIDTIADALVSVLDFVGIMLRIPGPIVGLTILAWGNSMGDLSANVTMARKGLGNMAMTACFAGPVFNILVGLGLGFGRLAAQTGQAVTEVHLQPSVVTGFIFLVLNSATILITGLVIGKGRINKLYGFTALSLYTVYVITSLLMQYTKGSGNSDGDG